MNTLLKSKSFMFFTVLGSLLMTSCTEKINIPYQIVSSQSNGEIKISHLEGRYDGQGEKQCDNYYSFGANTDSTTLYCYGCTTSEVVTLLTQSSLKSINNQVKSTKNFINLEIKKGKNFRLDVARKEIFDQLKIQVKPKQVSKQVWVVNKTKPGKHKGHTNGKSQILGKGDVVEVKHSTLSEIVESFNWLVKGSEFTTENSDAEKYTLEFKWPSNPEEVKALMLDFGCTTEEGMKWFTEYEVKPI